MNYTNKEYLEHVANNVKINSNETLWNAQEYYNEGDLVRYEGIEYRALRWNINEVPLLCMTGAWEKYQAPSEYISASATRSSHYSIGFGRDSSDSHYTPVEDSVFLDLQYEQDIKSVLKGFDFKKIKAFNISEDKICTRLLLPTIGDEDTVLSWESNSPKHISSTGEVCRPQNGKDYPVWLQLTVSKGDLYGSKVFELWVCAENKEIILNEEESVELAFKALSFDDFKGLNTNISCIKENLYFPLEGKCGVKLAWLSMQKEYLKDDGTIKRTYLEEDKIVKLHVVIRKGKVQMHKRFFLNIKGAAYGK